jgi:hypothetical protein
MRTMVRTERLHRREKPSPVSDAHAQPVCMMARLATLPMECGNTMPMECGPPAVMQSDVMSH